MTSQPTLIEPVKRRRNRFRFMLAMSVACVLSGALLTAAPAGAASRGFFLHNESGVSLRLEAVERVPTFICESLTRCVETHYPMSFEGRPADEAVLAPGHAHRWELKYHFDPTGGVQYAANLWYRIVGTDDTVEYTIETWVISNESACRINGRTRFTCTAAGTKLTFK